MVAEAIVQSNTLLGAEFQAWTNDSSGVLMAYGHRESFGEVANVPAGELVTVGRWIVEPLSPVSYEGDDKVVFDPDAMEIDTPYPFWFLGHWMIVRKLRDDDTLDFYYLPDPYDTEES